MKKVILVGLLAVLSMQISFAQTSSGKISLDCKVDVKLGTGYTTSKMFVLNGENFLFCHNSNTGHTAIWNLRQGGDPVLSKDWSKGWSNIEFYEFKGDVYFFHQKEGEGTARMNKLDYDKIMSNTSMGPQVFNEKWSKGWSTTKFFVDGDIVYFLHYKKSTGLARLNAATRGGTVGKKIYEKKWSTGYTNFAMTTYAGNFFMIYQKGGEGSAVINKINLPKLETAAKAGLLSPNLGNETYRGKWSEGWDNMNFFKLKGVPYLFFNKPKDGTARIEELSFTGKLSTRVYDKKWSAGWDRIDIFYKFGRPRLFHQKSGTGQTKICELAF